MSRVVFILSKTKEQLEEYKKIKNKEYDNKIAKSTQKTETLVKQKEEFNKAIDEQIKNAKD